MKRNNNFYRYTCFGKNYAVVDFLNEGAFVPSDFVAVRLDVSADAEIVLKEEPDYQTLLATGAFFIKERGLPLDEYTADINGKLRTLRFIKAGNKIGVNIEQPKYKIEKDSALVECKKLAFEKLYLKKRVFCLFSKANVLAHGTELADIYKETDAKVCIISLSSGTVNFKMYPEEPFDTEFTAVLAHKYRAERVTDGVYSADFCRKNGEFYILWEF